MNTKSSKVLRNKREAGVQTDGKTLKSNKILHLI